ncbi:MAG: hypothetical protein ACFFG0_02795 [Candidatus Thorarchaeota archaeon]
MIKHCSTIVFPSNFPSEFSYGKRHNIDLEITQQVAPSEFDKSNSTKSHIMPNFKLGLQARSNLQ